MSFDFKFEDFSGNIGIKNSGTVSPVSHRVKLCRPTFIGGGGEKCYRIKIHFHTQPILPDFCRRNLLDYWPTIGCRVKSIIQIYSSISSWPRHLVGPISVVIVGKGQQ